MPRGDGQARQLSRKGWLNGRAQSSQLFAKTEPLLIIFPEKTFSWESLA